MKALADSALNVSDLILGKAGWRCHFFGQVHSTNDIAKMLPAWSAVVASVQTGGRGRFARKFFSDEGGLYLSAVLPCESAAIHWVGFSLAAGLAVLEAIFRIGVRQARLRWPNDLMAGSRKFGGILVEQIPSQRICVGIGLNVTNAPWLADPSLEDKTCRLADMLEPVPEISLLVEQLLDCLADEHEYFKQFGMPGVIGRLNPIWERRRVYLDLGDAGFSEGVFDGLNENGDLLLLDGLNRRVVVPHVQVRQLVEM